MIVKLLEITELDSTPKKDTYLMSYGSIREKTLESRIPFEVGNHIRLFSLDGESRLRSSPILNVEEVGGVIRVQTLNTIYVFEEIQNYIVD